MLQRRRKPSNQLLWTPPPQNNVALATDTTWCSEHELNFACRVGFDVPDSVVESVGDIIDVVRRQSTHVDTTTAEQVNMVVLHQVIALLHCNAKEENQFKCKNSNLLSAFLSTMNHRLWSNIRATNAIMNRQWLGISFCKALREWRVADVFWCHFTTTRYRVDKQLEKSPFTVKTRSWVRTVESGVAEHAGLRDDVFPRAGSTERRQLVEQHLSHQENPVRHQLHVILPEAPPPQKKSSLQRFVRDRDISREQVQKLRPTTEAQLSGTSSFRQRQAEVPQSIQQLGLYRIPHIVTGTNWGQPEDAAFEEKLFSPFGAELWVVEDCRNDSAAVARRVGPRRPHHDRHLRSNLGHLLRAVDHERQIPNTFVWNCDEFAVACSFVLVSHEHRWTVDTHCTTRSSSRTTVQRTIRSLLSRSICEKGSTMQMTKKKEVLTQEKVVLELYLPNRPSIFVQISWRKSLIRAVKEGEKFLFLQRHSLVSCASLHCILMIWTVVPFPRFFLLFGGTHTRITAAIWCHCSSVGSTPVGLCAHMCSKMQERSGAFYRIEKVDTHTHNTTWVDNDNLNTTLLNKYPQIFQHAFNIQSPSCLIPVTVRFHIEPKRISNSFVISWNTTKNGHWNGFHLLFCGNVNLHCSVMLADILRVQQL